MSKDDLPLERLYRWERERPAQIFLSQPLAGALREWTWSEAALEVRRMAGFLQAQNWPPASQVAILSKNCAWWVMADLAIWMAGHVTVPIYPSLRPETVRQILEHSDARACFIGATEDKEADRLGLPAGVAPIRFPTASAGAGPDWDGVMSASTSLAGEPTRAADDVATIFYTSGTTGAPKGVVHAFRAFSFQAQALVRRLTLGSDERILSYLPLAHILERGGLEVPAVVFGWHLFFTQGPETFVADLQRARATLFYAVPRLLLKLQQGVLERVPKNRLDRLLGLPLLGRMLRRRILRRLGLDTVRFAFCGGAPLPPELLLWYRNLGLDLMEGYGLTEAMITHLPGPGRVRPGFVGRALDGVEAKRAPDGELLLRSPMNLLRYHKDPLGTRDAFTPDGFFRTGDLVEIDTDGQLKIIGRLKEQFKSSKGKYVAPAPIETRLLAHHDVEACCVMGAGLPRPFAVLLLTEEARQRAADARLRQALEDSLARHLVELNAQLEAHERIDFLAIVEGPWTIANGLMTPTLKFRRALLEERYRALVEAWQSQHRNVVWETAEEKTRHAGGG